MKTFNLLIIGLMMVFGFVFVPDVLGQCNDVPTTPEMGVCSTYRLDYDYRYVSGLSPSNPCLFTFVMLQWWGCCSLNGDCNISITTAYGSQPTKDWESEDGVEADFIFTAKGKYVVGAGHPGLSNCSGGTSVRILNFFLTNHIYDRDADNTKNWEDTDVDGDGLNNNQDSDDDNDDILDVNDSTPGGEGTDPTMWQQNGWSPTPTPTYTPTATPTATPTPTPTLCMYVVPKMHCPGAPSSGDIYVNGSWGHGMVKMYINNISALPTAIQQAASTYNNIYIGKYPTVGGFWAFVPFPAKITVNDTFGDNPIGKYYSISSLGNYSNGITYLVDTMSDPGYYSCIAGNCVDFVESLAGSSGVSLPSSISFWGGYSASFPGIMGKIIYLSGGYF